MRRGVTANGYGGGFWGDVGECENILKLIVVMVAQLCDDTKNHGVGYFKSVNCMVI